MNSIDTSPSKLPAVEVAIAVLRNVDGDVLVTRRADTAHQGGLWEFPGGKLESGEMPHQALQRELQEEIGVTVGATRPLMQVRHRYADREVLLHVLEVEQFAGQPWGREAQPLEWVAASQLDQRAWPAANAPIVRAVGLPALYAISGPWPQQGGVDAYVERIERVLEQGVRLLQLRVPEASDAELRAVAGPVVARCREHGARCLINTDPATAMALGADGVQLNGQCLDALRERPLAADALVGASCHNRAQLAQAAAIGADFALLSPVLPTASHPGAATLGWEGFAALSADATLPVYALGGMTTGSVAMAQAHGGHGVAVLGALWPV